MRTTFLTFTIFCTFSLLAQKAPFKFGKISTEEIAIEECAFYPEADAMILGEFGELRFNYHNDKGWQYVLDVTRRIKIFNTAGKEYGNVALRVYEPVQGANREEITTVRGYTYNIVDGKVDKIKLTNSEEYKTRLSDYRVEVSFAMPNVQEGSVIEYQYTIVSDFISTLNTWHFQGDLPTALSEFRYKIPEYFNYNVSQVGNVIPIEREEKVATENFMYRWENVGTAGKITRGTGSLESKSQYVVAVCKDIPPVLDEPYMNNRPNVPARLEFQLMSIKMPNQPYKMVASNYQEFNNTIMEWSSFGSILDKGGFAKEKVSKLEGSQSEKAIEIYNWIKNHFSFNGVYGMTSGDAGRKAFNEKSGSVAAINLSLVAAYREAGLEAYPIVLSTRGHGIPHPVYPNYENFNYVIAAVNTENGFFFTDATTSLAFGMLPSRCLNGKGWLATKDEGMWVDLKENRSHNTTVFSAIKFDEELISSAIQCSYENYAAIDEYTTYNKVGEEDYSEKIAARFPDYEVNEIEVDDNGNRMKVQFNVLSELDDEETIYLQPIQYGTIQSNPFKREERYSPVDYPYSVSNKVIVTVEVPEGYQAELPEPAVIALPENAGKFTYSINQQGNTISIMSWFDLKKTLFTPGEYAYLKQFYNLVSEKHSEMIVLKKI